MNRRITGLAAAAVMAAAMAGAEEITLGQAVSEALAKHPSIEAATAARDGAAARVAEARASWLPRAEVTAASTRSDNPVFVFGSLLEQGRFGAQHFDPAFLNDPSPLRNDRLALTLRYTLFDQFRRYDTLLETRNGLTAADAASDAARQQLRLDVLNRYFALALAQQRVEVAREAVRAAETAAAAIADKFAQGLVVESDHLSAAVQLASERQQEISAAGELAIARASLALALDRPLTAELSAVTRLEENELPAIDLAQAVEKGLERRPELRASTLATSNSRLRLRTARGQFLPRIDLYASRGASGSTFRDRDYDTTAGAVLALDLFDGAKFARVAAARAAAAAAEADSDLVRQRVTMEIVTAFHRTTAARERVSVAAKAETQARAAADMVRDRYENGLSTITEHLRAQTALVRARLDLLAARHDHLAGYAALLRSIGGLNDVDLFS